MNILIAAPRTQSPENFWQPPPKHIGHEGDGNRDDKPEQSLCRPGDEDASQSLMRGRLACYAERVGAA